MTLEPIPYAQPVQVQKNRRGLLMGFGILAICLGMLCIGWIGYFVFTVLRFRPYQPMYQRGASLKELLEISIGIALIASVAGIFITGGIGMIRCRRWVVPLGYAMSLVWLIVGVLFLELMFSEFYSDLDDPMLWLVIGISLVLLVILPLVYLGVFRSENVAKTVDVYDPYPRWTDRYPRAVMSIGVLCAAAAIGFLTSISAGVERCFVTFIHDDAAMALTAGWAGLFAIAAGFCFFKPRLGWKVVMVALTLYAFCGVMTDIAYDPGPVRGAGVIGVSDAYDTRNSRVHERPRRIINHAVVLTICWVAGFWYLVAVREDFAGSDETEFKEELGAGALS